MHAVATATSINEAVGVVGARELLLGVGHRDVEEVTEGLPALAHLVLEEVLGRDERADFGVVLVESSLAVLLKVALPETFPKFCEDIVRSGDDDG